MSGPAFPDDYGLTVERFEADTEGTRFETAAERDDTFECDFCSKHVSYASEPRIGQYHADAVLNRDSDLARRINRERPLATMATYCPDCTTRRLLFPHEGTMEVRLLADLGADKRLTNVEVTDVSPHDDGIPWDPRELSESITGIPFDQHVGRASEPGAMLWAPENMVTFFLSIGGGIDIREVVRWDGSLDPQALGRARTAYREYIEKMQAARASGKNHRREFTKHVRGDRENENGDGGGD